jgi:endo-1,4-beta-mannosidase
MHVSIPGNIIDTVFLLQLHQFVGGQMIDQNNYRMAGVTMPVHPFLSGINYWPANKAMYWWKAFDLTEVAEDFQKLRAFGLDVVRIFLLWEDFQPRQDGVSTQALDHLRRVADLADKMGLKLMPTFFCGHMSGVNWMPEWMLASTSLPQRFPVYSNGRLQYAAINNFYTDEELLTSQLLQLRKVSQALAGHPAVYAYDLGNESSNCVIPPDRSLGIKWLNQVCREIRQASPSTLITLGMHAEDLEQDRHLWPQDAACFCDFLCMHGYPFYLSWVDDPLDYRLLPFLGIITRWLGEKEVLLQEFGAPTLSQSAHSPQPSESEKYSCPLWSEAEQSYYYQQSLRQLQQAGMLGAMAWCFSDYQPSLWNQAPLRDNPHERHFGLFRQDGSAKPAVQAWEKFVAQADDGSGQPGNQPSPNWLKDYQSEKFYERPQENLAELFKRYKESD